MPTYSRWGKGDGDCTKLFSTQDAKRAYSDEPRISQPRGIKLLVRRFRGVASTRAGDPGKTCHLPSSR